MFLKKLHYVCLESYFLLKQKKKERCRGGGRQVRMISQEKIKVGVYNASYLNCKCRHVDILQIFTQLSNILT